MRGILCEKELKIDIKHSETLTHLPCSCDYDCFTSVDVVASSSFTGKSSTLLFTHPDINRAKTSNNNAIFSFSDFIKYSSAPVNTKYYDIHHKHRNI